MKRDGGGIGIWKTGLRLALAAMAFCAAFCGLARPAAAQSGMAERQIALYLPGRQGGELLPLAWARLGLYEAVANADEGGLSLYAKPTPTPGTRYVMMSAGEPVGRFTVVERAFGKKKCGMYAGGNGEKEWYGKALKTPLVAIYPAEEVWTGPFAALYRPEDVEIIRKRFVKRAELTLKEMNVSPGSLNLDRIAHYKLMQGEGRLAVGNLSFEGVSQGKKKKYNLLLAVTIEASLFKTVLAKLHDGGDERLIDALDANQDGVAELFTQRRGPGGSFYQIYQYSGGAFTSVFKGGFSKCDNP